MADQLEPCNQFPTPEDLAELHKWIKVHPANKRGGMLTVMGMTWNFCAKITNEADTLSN